ncbi:MAG TPA: hypothetical protein DCQ26_00635 [Marinilabiliales bacterium]|jgi:hypothetical protein|nr:MAG: hypothetical protein A2W95_17790 [Bacteroidetes bacterium GWA2_40_14]OFX61382.1 MAG: hypothetical protein A2W84_14735 [Bacteroidetes bacterium GWC2_40_13]OFX72555.1 MAG: hypothetical protein A2W96_04905 [Bacteroidetes bacterium GWD2_40_43]OFX94157.1 MAG: hypothetical protein A2W97_17705 [Bacteroidetes bacterium GWE2_40_63]OFY20309.1 MAG: hypothetical protein A2W88_12675 [Bacteroidetes bacterium GWF2_40_13]OFZ31844.1 MAG: hypothetical protein A2437_07895 [Bacteroidetes bacterium RIFOXYC
MEATFKLRLLKKPFLLYSSIISLFVAFSCNDASEDDVTAKLIGTWQQTSRTVDGTPATLDSTRLVVQINNNSICVLYDSSYTAISTNKVLIRSGWSYNNGLLNIAVDLPASWAVNANDNGLGMDRVDFKQDGTIAKTSIHFERIANIEQE